MRSISRRGASLIRSAHSGASRSCNCPSTSTAPRIPRVPRERELQTAAATSHVAEHEVHPLPTDPPSPSTSPIPPSPAPLSGPLAAYNTQVSEHLISNDDHQRSIVTILQSLHTLLDSYSPPEVPEWKPPPPPLTFFERHILRKKEEPILAIPPIPEETPKGLYLYGSVGCGKSFLMDLFYAHLPSKYSSQKRRVHFHAFMADVHKRGHLLKTRAAAKGELGREEWIVEAARDLARDARVLCFDEFQVTDIADAMILRRLMESLMAFGVVAVVTSNRAPDELYKNGIQREQFLPCIDLIKDRFVVQCLDSEIDYRKRPRALSKVYFSPLSTENNLEMSKLFDSLTSSPSSHSDPVVSSRPLTVWGRTLLVPESTSKIARFSFKELCGLPLSASDYLEITKNFETVFVEGVPQLGLDTKDQARRFILFIDAAYEARTKLFISSDPPITEVFSDAQSKNYGEITAHQRAVMDDLGLTADVVGASSMFTGEEEVFAFARAISRLNEMSGVQWARQEAKGTPVDTPTK